MTETRLHTLHALAAVPTLAGPVILASVTGRDVLLACVSLAGCGLYLAASRYFTVRWFKAQERTR